MALHRRIAALWADKLGKHQNAVASLEKILEADPPDPETSARLKELYTRSRAWRPLLEVYRKELPARLAPRSGAPAWPRWRASRASASTTSREAISL